MLTAKSYRKRLHGWLSYAFASEVFVIVSLTLFLPICLEQFARDNGYLLPDKTIPCTGVPGEPQDGRCVVKIGWVWIDTASFSLYTYSASVALQALTVISMGGIADHPPHRKVLLLTFAYLGATAATLFLLLTSSSPVWWLASGLACIANVGFGASIVAMNSYLPSLAKDAPEVVAVMDELQDAPGDSSSHESENPDAPLIAPTAERTALQARYENELSRATSRISSLGVAIGYGAGICLLALALIPVIKLKGTTFSLRLAIGSSGIWWALFTIPAALWLPGASSIDEPSPKDWSFRHEIVAAWKRLGGMLHPREIAKLRNTFKYLAAWFLLSDGFTTITSTAVLFGKTTLHMQPSALIVIGVLTPLAGIGGSLMWPFLQRSFGWSNLRVLTTLVMLASVVPAYGCLGFLPLFHGEDKVRFGGLTSPEEMFVLALYFGSIYGAFQSFARAFYAELLPPGEEARWYGLFSITDKSSSFIGPLIVGLIADTTGNIRYSFFFLVFMVWAAVPVLLSVNVERGRKDARDYRYRA
ncbi:Autophagy-related protein [Mycena indigotica]|uniref:Autophagy-related protein n=1 Tax=Mycena indigotica TaxID=2126181 RepID=A0A8H6S2E0_9AGAR|nr:Autophagy-related protein [Mycena indigotica]KAF7290592.1 Autophagy-related protein [Mycena indigotica]